MLEAVSDADGRNLSLTLMGEDEMRSKRDE